MRDVPREIFVDPAFASLAYSDAQLVVSGKTRREMTAPLILARLLKEAHLLADDRVLVVAGGTGYAAALAAGLVKSVVSLDDDESLAARADGQFRDPRPDQRQISCRAAGGGGAGRFAFRRDPRRWREPGRFRRPAEPAREGGRLVGIVSDKPGARVGKAILYRRVGGQASPRPLFDASAGALHAFAKPAAFVF